MEHVLIGVFLVATGGFSIVCAAMDAEWFINSRKARLPLTMFGRNGTRVFYIVLGVVIAAAGIGFATGLIPLRSK